MQTTPEPFDIPAVVDQCGRRHEFRNRADDGGAYFCARRSRQPIYLSAFCLSLIREGRGATIEELVDQRTGRTRLFSYRMAD